MQFAILKGRYYDYTIVYKEEDTYYYLSSKTDDTKVYWNPNIQDVLDNSIMKTDCNIFTWIKYVAVNNIIWLDIDKPENIPIKYPELLI
jgi:hypothetical protein